MALRTYTQTAGAADGTSYFEDVVISPATLHDGTLQARFNTLVYPQLGVDNRYVDTTTVATASSTTPVHAVAVTLTATVTGQARGGTPAGTVTFKDATSTLGTGALSASGVATYAVTGGFATGAHPITAVYAGSGLNEPSTSGVLTITASSS